MITITIISQGYRKSEQILFNVNLMISRSFCLEQHQSVCVRVGSCSRLNWVENNRIIYARHLCKHLARNLASFKLNFTYFNAIFFINNA